ncbi:cAMP-specific 3',5'-cyclic phosphodiesterase 7B [Cricetulus griseus]|nr:cAMP-specific 3',5'-cyclic phosphodiesterase 7B [Cricetulus griseus]
MPVLERYFHSAELGRRWTAPEGDVRLRGQTGVPAERRGSYPFIDFRLLNMDINRTASTVDSMPGCKDEQDK